MSTSAKLIPACLILSRILQIQHLKQLLECRQVARRQPPVKCPRKMQNQSLMKLCGGRMKRTVIKYNKIAHERAIAKINAIRRIIDDFKDAYAKFQDDTEMENLDQGAMIAIMEDGRRVLERMIDAYVAKQPKPLRKYYAEACYGALNEHLDPILN